jgi:serine protease Do
MPPQVVVIDVQANSQAERLGLRPGDRILTYDGKPITAAAALLTLVRAPGEGTREVEILRNDERLRFTVAPGILGIRWDELPSLRTR